MSECFGNGMLTGMVIAVICLLIGWIVFCGKD
jgi:hypothetical protein